MRKLVFVLALSLLSLGLTCQLPFLADAPDNSNPSPDPDPGDPDPGDPGDPGDIPYHLVGSSGAVFRTLGHLLPSGQVWTTGVSGDGGVVVGWASSGMGESAFRWQDGVMTELGGVPGLQTSTAYGVSADGSTVVGIFKDSEHQSNAFRWTASTGMTPLGRAVDDDSSQFAEGVSADGSVVVGYRFDSASSRLIGFRWTAQSGFVDLIESVHDSFESEGVGVSADGSVVVGRYAPAQSVFSPVKWMFSGPSAVMEYLGAEDAQGRASAVSPDGTVIAGMLTASPAEISSWGSEAFRWTPAGGVTGLGDLPGSSIGSAASAISADGQLVVGSGTVPCEGAQGTPTCFGKPQAFIWSASKGLRRLSDALKDDYGLDLGRFELVTATGISSDGRTIVGSGSDSGGPSEGWIVTLPVAERSYANDLQQLNLLRAEIDALIQDKSCSDSTACAVSAIGAKACGGPAGYVVYSRTVVDEAAVKDKIAQFNALMDDMNHRYDVTSDCSFITVPSSTVCDNGQCTVP